MKILGLAKLYIFRSFLLLILLAKFNAMATEKQNPYNFKFGALPVPPSCVGLLLGNKELKTLNQNRCKKALNQKKKHEIAGDYIDNKVFETLQVRGNPINEELVYEYLGKRDGRHYMLFSSMTTYEYTTLLSIKKYKDTLSDLQIITEGAKSDGGIKSAVLEGDKLTYVVNVNDEKLVKDLTGISPKPKSLRSCMACSRAIITINYSLKTQTKQIIKVELLLQNESQEEQKNPEQQELNKILNSFTAGENTVEGERLTQLIVELKKLPGNSSSQPKVLD